MLASSPVSQALVPMLAGYLVIMAALGWALAVMLARRRFSVTAAIIAATGLGLLADERHWADCTIVWSAVFAGIGAAIMLGAVRRKAPAGRPGSVPGRSVRRSRRRRRSAARGEGSGGSRPLAMQVQMRLPDQRRDRTRHAPATGCERSPSKPSASR